MAETSKWQIFWQTLTAIGTIGTFTATMMAAFIAYPEFHALYISPPIEIKFSALSSNKLGEPISLEYTLPSSGYYSLWNKDSAGKIERIYPHTGGSNFAKKNPDNYRGLRYLKADTINVEESIILLWAEKKLYLPINKGYINNYLFTQEIKSSVKRAIATIQIQ